MLRTAAAAGRALATARAAAAAPAAAAGLSGLARSTPRAVVGAGPAAAGVLGAAAAAAAASTGAATPAAAARVGGLALARRPAAGLHTTAPAADDASAPVGYLDKSSVSERVLDVVKKFEKVGVGGGVRGGCALAGWWGGRGPRQGTGEQLLAGARWSSCGGGRQRGGTRRARTLPGGIGARAEVFVRAHPLRRCDGAVGWTRRDVGWEWCLRGTSALVLLCGILTAWFRSIPCAAHVGLAGVSDFCAAHPPAHRVA